MRHTAIVLFCLVITNHVLAQKDSLQSERGKIYKMHPKYQLPLAGAAIVLSSLGFKALDANASMSAEDVMKLNAYDVNAFDRQTALRDPSGFNNAAGKGDFLLNFSVASPLLLGLDKNIRKDWVDLLTLYLTCGVVKSRWVT